MAAVSALGPECNATLTNASLACTEVANACISHVAFAASVACSVVLGGVLFMLLGMTYLVATMLCIALPMMGLKQYLAIGHVPSARRLTMIALLVAGALILSAVTHYVPLWLGRQALEKREG